MTSDSGADTPGHRQTPGGGVAPEARPIEPAAPDEFGLVQAFWGDGKGKTTAAMGMGFRAAGHGYRVHMLQFMKGGADSVDDVRGEYNAIAAMPGFSYENTGHYGWHNMADGSREADHESEADAGFERTKELVAAAADADLTTPFALDSDPEAGVHMLILDEILYAADRDLVAPAAVCELIEIVGFGLDELTDRRWGNEVTVGRSDLRDQQAQTPDRRRSARPLRHRILR